MENQYQDIYDWLTAQKPEAVDSIVKSGNAFYDSLLEALHAFKIAIAVAMAHDDYEKVDLLNSYCKRLYSLGESIMEMIPGVTSAVSRLSEQDSTPIPTSQSVSAPSTFTKAKIDYSLYQVNPHMPHSLSEDFANTKICAYQIGNDFVPVDNWKEALLSVCARAARWDMRKLHSFVGNSEFSGRLNDYFGTAPIVRDGLQRNAQIPGTDLYVWTNISATQIVNLIRKILKKYNKEEILIYLRADYSPLHK